MQIDYRVYIQSTAWKNKHKSWLLESSYRCSMFPWILCGKSSSYRIHHMTYKNLGDETLWQDVIVLCPFAHDFIVHGILSGFKSAGKQRGKYPNRYQKIAHAWCCLPLIIKLAAMAATSFAIAYFSVSTFGKFI